MVSYCKCKDCKRAKRRGKILGARLLRHLGGQAYRVSGYVPHPKWQNGKRLRRQGRG